MATEFNVSKESIGSRTSSDCDTFGSPGSPPSSPSEQSASADQADVQVTKQASCNSQSVAVGRKIQRRKHTLEEKRVIRRERRRRKRQTRAAIIKAKQLQRRNAAAAGSSRDVLLYKEMARHYRDRWQQELQKHKETAHYKRGKICTSAGLHEINPSFLTNPTKDKKSVEIYLGHGSFSIVQLKIYIPRH